jgi:hypothetical protein
MGYNEDIDNAIAAHGLWKQRLHSAITKGAHIFSLAQVQVDNGCDFGKWFYGLPAALQETGQGKAIQGLHASFHTEAARILILALDGHVAEAEKALESGSVYARLSAQLTLALTEWKQTIGN